MNGRTFFLEYPDCKTALAWRLLPNADSPDSVDELSQGAASWTEHMASTAYRFLISDEYGNALEGNPMSDYLMETQGFRVIWATIH